MLFNDRFTRKQGCPRSIQLSANQVCHVETPACRPCWFFHLDKGTQQHGWNHLAGLPHILKPTGFYIWYIWTESEMGIWFYILWSVVAGRGPLLGPEVGLLCNTQKWIVRADKARDFIGKGHLGGEREGQETQDCSATWLTVLGFCGDGRSFWIVSGQSLPQGPYW